MNISRRHLLQAVGGIAPLAVIGIPRDAQASMMGHLFDWLNSRPVESPKPGEGILEFAARVLPEITANEKFYVQSIGHSCTEDISQGMAAENTGRGERPAFDFLCGFERATTGENLGDDNLYRKSGGRRTDRKRLVGRNTAQNAHRACRRGGKRAPLRLRQGHFSRDG